jgi:hypothetical protein
VREEEGEYEEAAYTTLAANLSGEKTMPGRRSPFINHWRKQARARAARELA